MINTSDWCTAMSDVLNMDLPWRSLRPQLVNTSANDSDCIIYESTFDAYTIHNKYGEASKCNIRKIKGIIMHGRSRM